MKHIILIVLSLPCIVWAQNLVPNPGFESNTGCPSRRAQWYLASDWTNSTVRVNNGQGNTNGSPDYFNTCGSGDFAPPRTYYGIMTPRSGNAMMGIATYRSYSPNFREYLGIRLDSVLLPGNTYEVEFYYANGVNASPSIFNFGGQGTVLGVHFSNAPLTQFNAQTPLLLPTDFETATPVYSAGWQKLSFTFSPTAPVQYLNIGNFRNDANTTVNLFATPGILRKAYYFFDDISITRSRPLETRDDGVEIAAQESVEAQFFFSEGTLHIQPNQQETLSFHIEVMDIKGRILWSNNGRTDREVIYNTPNLSPGVYIARLQTPEGQKTLRFLKSR